VLMLAGPELGRIRETAPPPARPDFPFGWAQPDADIDWAPAQIGGCACYLNKGLITVRDRLNSQSRGNAVDYWLLAGLAAGLWC
jgi:hypothetical protein